MFKRSKLVGRPVRVHLHHSTHMRGRGRSSSSSVSQEQTRMALRRKAIRDSSDLPSGSQQIEENSQEDEAVGDNNDELSSSLLPPLSLRERRKRERENKSKPKEMTEEEMMDLALRLSEQEASINALQLQNEEEAMMKAIQESMISQTQLCPPSQSQSLQGDADASLRICSRRKLLYSNRRPMSAIDQGASEVDCTPETDLNHQGAKRSGDESNSRSKKRKRKEGSPLLEMPDLSQTQDSPRSSEILDPDSPQSCDSTQIDDCELRESPVFPLTGCRAEVHVPRLSQDLLQTCRTSGFVLCSQDSVISPARPRSPTFPQSLKICGDLSLSKSTADPQSQILPETDQGDDGETEPSPQYLKSPVFGRTTQHEKSPSASNPLVGVCNSGFMISSQESLTSSVRSPSCQPESPVFPRSPNLPKNLLPPERSATCKSPVFSGTDGGQTEQSGGHCTSPVFGRTGIRQKNHLGSSREGTPAATRSSPQSLTQDKETNHSRDDRFDESSKSDDADEELKDISKVQDSAEMELTSDMMLLLSEEDDDVTPVGSPSPVFPDEPPVHRADGQLASLNNVTAASPGTNCRSPSSSSSTGGWQLSATEQEQQPIGSQGAVRRASAPPGEPAAGGSTVHYYWGVPFCPRGLDPDNYTQVILAQMEVYEKSLKQAQRSLLRKAEWGEAVLPQLEKSPSPESPAESPQQIFPRRRGVRLRGKKLCDEADSPSVDEPGEDEGRREEEERENKEEKQNEGEEGQVDTDDCEVCPETQLSDNDDDRTQDLVMDTDTETQVRPKSPELPELEMILQGDSPAGGEPQDQEMEMEVEVEVDAPVDRKTKGSVPVSSSDSGQQCASREELEEDRGDPDVEEIKEGVLQRSTSPELEPAVIPQSSNTSVDCPICQGSFPVTEIEMHAAYCDGEVAVVDRRSVQEHRSRWSTAALIVTLKPRRKRTRRAEVTDEETNNIPNTGKNQERCFICQKVVPLRDYSRHTELCIQQSSAKTAAKGNLLSALEITESRDSEAGPSGSKLQPEDVIDLRDDDEEEDECGMSSVRISNSPIRSFTPISEATDCLIDFKKQRSKKLSQRRR